MTLPDITPFSGLADAYGDQQQIVSRRGTLLPREDAATEQCFFIFVPKNITGKDLLSVEIKEQCTRLLVVLEEGASAKVHVRIACKDADALHTVEIFLADEAELSLLSMQESEAPTLTIWQRSSLGANAKLHMQNVSLGTGRLEHNLLSDVRGVNGESSVDWLFYSKNKEHQHIHARNVFHAKNGSGEIVMKGVAEDEAHAICTGMIDIGLGGGGTDTYLTEDVLMLDKTAKVDAVPGLEIKTNDVKASHSATVSKVTKDDLFYFAARGIPERIAREMYVLGFLGDLTQRIANEQERAQVLEAIEQKYQH